MSTQSDRFPGRTVPTSLVLEPGGDGTGVATLHVYGANAQGAYALNGDTLVVSFPEDVFEGTWLPTSASSYCPDVFIVETLTLSVTREGGRIVSAQGGGSGQRARWMRDDAPSPNPFTFTVPEARTDDGASIVLEGSEGVHPLSALEARVTGPSDVAHLALRTSGSELAFDTMQRVSGFRRPVTGDVVAYERVGVTPLLWGATYTVAADPADTDAFGRPIGAASFSVAAAPSFFDTPGFEGSVHALLRVSARISNTSDVGFALPHEGTGALMLGSDGEATIVFPNTEVEAPTELLVRARYVAYGGVPRPLSLRFFDDTEVVSMEATPDGIVSTDGSVIETMTVSLPAFARVGAFSLELASRNMGEACGYNPIRYGEIVIEELRLQ